MDTLRFCRRLITATPEENQIFMLGDADISSILITWTTEPIHSLNVMLRNLFPALANKTYFHLRDGMRRSNEELGSSWVCR